MGDDFFFQEDDHQHTGYGACEVGGVIEAAVTLISGPGGIDKVTDAGDNSRHGNDKEEVENGPGLKQDENENDTTDSSGSTDARKSRIQSMPKGGGDIGKNNIEEVEDEIDHTTQHTAKFMSDKRFNVVAKTVQHKHVDNQVGPICMDEA